MSGGTFRLDGGARFGTVLTVAWHKTYRADEENQILLATTCLLIRGEVEGRLDSPHLDVDPADVLITGSKGEGAWAEVLTTVQSDPYGKPPCWIS